MADLAAKRALEAWRGDAEFADQYCGWVKFASAVAQNVAKSQSNCLQNLPLGANELQVKRSTPVPQPPCRDSSLPRVVLVAPHNTHALWVTEDFMICMRCGSWSKVSRLGRGLRGPLLICANKKRQRLRRTGHRRSASMGMIVGARSYCSVSLLQRFMTS